MLGPARQGLAVVVSGPSGSGKTTIVKHLMLRYPRSHFSLSATTRSLRGEEVNGMDYRFIARSDFLALRDQGGFLEWAEVHNEFYGTPRDEVCPYLQDGRHVFLDIDVQGGLSVKAALKEKAFLLYVLPPDWATLERRLRGRGTESEEAVRLRLANALKELQALPRYDAVVINDKLPVAVDEAQRLLDAGERNAAAWLASGGDRLLHERFGLTVDRIQVNHNQ